jgi:hypothetical protein
MWGVGEGGFEGRERTEEREWRGCEPREVAKGSRGDGELGRPPDSVQKMRSDWGWGSQSLGPPAWWKLWATGLLTFLNARG